MGAPAASVVIATRNRKSEVLLAVRSCLDQSVPMEVIVIDDGSSDGTADALRAGFPEVRVERHETAEGATSSRNQGFSMATREIVFQIDDDAVMRDPETVSVTLEDFAYPQVGIVALPMFTHSISVGPLGLPRISAEPVVVPRFVGAGMATRRDLFLQLGGYPPEYFFYGEENDLCLQMLAAGYVTVLGRCEPIDHRPSTSRSNRRQDVLPRRNDLLLGWMRMPVADLPYHVAKCLGSTGRLLARRQWAHGPLAHIEGVLRGFGTAVTCRRARAPVPRSAVRLDRLIAARRQMPLNEVLPLLDHPKQW